MWCWCDVSSGALIQVLSSCQVWLACCQILQDCTPCCSTVSWGPHPRCAVSIGCHTWNRESKRNEEFEFRPWQLYCGVSAGCNGVFIQSNSSSKKKNRPLSRMGGILSTVSSVYDPLGMLAPLILTAKKILQNLWRKKIGWGWYNIRLVQGWICWVQGLRKLENFKVGRYFKPTKFGTVTFVQLQHFSYACIGCLWTVSNLLL